MSTSSLAVQLVCDPAPYGQVGCSGGADLHVARAELNAAVVTVTDNQPPTLTGTTGSLFGSQGYQHGTVTGTISGTDNSGVASAIVYVDGHEIAEAGFACDFTYAEPCPGSATSSALSLDTTRLADGVHQVQAAVVDAAGNETRGPIEQLLVANHPPSAPTGAVVTNAPTGWINHAATLTWKNPAQGSGLPIAGVDWATCRGAETSIPPTGCGMVHAQKTPLTSLAEDPSTEPAFASSLAGNYTVFLWLVDAAGDMNPASFASASFGFDNASPGPPTSLRATPSSAGFAIRATLPAHVAPILSVNWVACKTGGKCTDARNAAGQAFGFDPATNDTFKTSPRGTYAIRAWLEDAAGNTSPTASASTTATYPASGVAPAATGKPSPLLRFTDVKVSGRDLRVAGTASRALENRVRVIEHYRVGRSVHVLRGSAVAFAGRFSTELVDPRGAHPERVTVIFAGNKHLRAETVTRKLAAS